MKRRPLVCLLLALTGAVRAFAQSTDTIEEMRRQAYLGNQAPVPPTVDAKGLIKASTSFLKEREPEMTTEEYALYEKVSAMLDTNADLAIKLLETMMGEKERPSPAFEFILGNAFAGANQFERAEASYRGAVTRYPTFLRAWNNLGLLYYTNNRFADAAGCFAKSVSLGDRDSATLGLLGYCQEQLGDPIAAEVAYLQALGTDPKNSDWKEGLLRLAINGRQYGRAGQLTRSLIREKPAETRLWLTYAGVLVAADRKLEAMAVLEQASAAKAVDPDALVLLGDLYAEQGLAAEAAGIYQRVLATAPARGEQKLLQFAGVLIATGNLPDAERALNALPGEPTPAYRLARRQVQADLWMARRRWPEARREIEALLALAPLDGRALLTLGRTWLEENNLPRAALAFEAARQVPESAYQANIELANVELKSRHYAKAAAHLAQALKLQRSDAIEDYLARIRALVPADAPSG